jgi:phage replication-related protein YjqB (UPF0714/DUF867 family)
MKSDVYRDLDSLKRDLREGRDYRIRKRKRRSPVLIVAPHGGYIDRGTSAIVGAIAGKDYSLFDFQGLISENSFRLHVTSHRFRDAVLTEILENSRFAVAVHGMENPENNVDEIWLGGQNRKLKAIVSRCLQAEGFDIDANPPKYKGEHPANVVNLPVEQGVQLELSLSLRAQMFAGSRFFYATGRCPKTTDVFERFIRAVRAAIKQYEQDDKANAL